jgi:hypothetical protein
MNFITPDWPAPAHIKAYTTVRTSWGDLASDHHHFHKLDSDTDKAFQVDNSRLKKLFHLPEDPIWINQVHSAIALPALPENERKKADALFTTLPNRVCLILTADCLPLLICNKAGTHVAAVHAGWRGLATGVIESTIDALEQDPAELLVWLGPAIGPGKFEVGKDVFDAFTQKQAETAIAFTPHKPDKWMANLYTLAKIRLQARGVTQIYGGDFCTYTQADLFFSYRRDQGRTGRMASLIWMANFS